MQSLKALALLPTVLLGLLVARSWACMCELSHPQTSFCDADYAIKARVERAHVVGQNFTSEYGSFYEHLQNVYSIRILHVFKGRNANITAGKMSTVMTEVSESTCGVSMRKGVTYLLTGLKHDGVLHLGLCDWFSEWVKVTPKQHKGLVSLYNFNCQCQVEACGEPDCQKQQQPKSCYWSSDPFSPLEDCLGRHSVCTRAQDSSCFWSRGRSRSDCERANSALMKQLRNSELLP